MTAELTEERLQVMKSIHRHDPEVRVAIDMALEHVRARGQKPVATVLDTVPTMSDNICAIRAVKPLPDGTPLFSIQG